MPKASSQKLKILYVMEFLLRNSDEEHPVSISQIAEYLEAVGIKATTAVCGPSDLSNWVKSDNYEVCVYIWTSGAMDSRYGYLTAPLLASQMMGQNIGADETVKALVSELSGTPIVDRATIAGKIQDYWSANAPMVPTYWYSYLVPYNSDLTGLCDHSTYGIICPDTMMNLKLKG